MRFQSIKLIVAYFWLLASVLMCAGAAAQSVSPPPLTDVTFSSPFINIGGSPQNIFVTPVPATASVANCAITSPTTALATYNPTYLLGPTITVSSRATGTTQAVQHTFTCGAVSKTFVVKPPTYPADIVLIGTQLQVGSTTNQNLIVSPAPVDTVLPACTITSTPALATVTVDAAGGTKIALTTAANAITADTAQTVTCGSLSKTFIVKPPQPNLLTLTGSGALKSGARTALTATIRYPDNRESVVNPVWSSSDQAVASVNAVGVVTAGVVSTPTPVTISAVWTENGATVTGRHVITVSAALSVPTDLTVTGSGTLQSGARTTLTATAKYTDNSTITVNPKWSSSNPVAAAVSAAGVVTAGVVSTTTSVIISAEWIESGVTVEARHVISVSAAPAVLTDLTIIGAASMQSGGQARLVVNAVYADHSSKAVSATGFTLSDPALGSVSSRGVLTVGSVTVNTVLTVTATYQEGGVTKTARLSITVSAAPAVLTRLTLVGATALVASGQTLNLSALGVYEDTSSKPVAATWQVTGTAATVSSTGVFQASSVSADTPVVVSASYTEAGVTVSAQFQVIIQATVPSSPIQAEVQATGTRSKFSLAVWTSATAFAPSGASLASANRASSLPPAAKARAVYKLFVMTLIPGGQLVPVDTIFTLNRNSEWQGLSFPVGEYLNGVTDDSVQLVEILDSLDVSVISGTKIYVGYGIDDLEMLASGRFRLVYQIQ